MVDQEKSYTRMTADVYNAIYGKKDYAQEATRLKEIIDEFKKSPGNQLLDVACGTGNHLAYLTDQFEITGLDLSEEQLVEARKRFPTLTFHQGDMRDFKLEKKFDVVTCLFSSIGYANEIADMQKAITNMAAHLLPGGVLIIEPWIERGKYVAGTVHATFVDEPELKISRINTSAIKDGKSILDLHHLVGRPSGVEYFVEHHELGLYSNDEYMNAIKHAGLITHHDEHGLTGRGLYIGVKRFD